MADIYVNDEKIGSFVDDLCECPEDAIWSRDLGDIFWMGVKAGLKAAGEGDIEVKNITIP